MTRHASRSKPTLPMKLQEPVSEWVSAHEVDMLFARELDERFSWIARG